ncbi:NADH dehydrogenase [ubiquinone] 1 beta subcomplex subunit 11, mitochondrial-like [Tubulanus polymorphus]|uniref:NADH dehydrogenase [ubiquinone] 1 beta subcomplex subunit 11, mitochondrial-like n=1 Tax=Tubulanus polymorphus TaxID=672921 RepID=UPI003DA5A3AD
MASLLRFVGGLRFSRNCGGTIAASVTRHKRANLAAPACFISTSQKNKEAVSVTSDALEKTKEKIVFPHPDAIPDEEHKNWISYGYSLTDKDEDEWAHNIIMFAGITLCLCGGSFIFAYLPDFQLQNWAQREAFLELARREELGLPLVDPNVIPVERINLPSDEELGDMEIII